MTRTGKEEWDVTQRRRRAAWRDVRRPGPLLVLGALLGACILGGVIWVGGRLRERTLPRPLHPLKTRPQDYPWTAQPEPAFPIPPYARYLAGVRIILDPGHVGQRDPGGTWKRGPTGLREALVNLRVAQFLREFLTAAGAEATLTRETDECLDLPDKDDLRRRVELANRSRADLFISIHHNAAADATVNYTAVFYHASPGYSPASLCAARHLLESLNDALRLESHLECAVVSDELLYENGLAVLRDAEVPAVLTEASFHSHPNEEHRLRDPVYNRREAYGLFLGLARWAQAGLPRVRLVQIEPGKGRSADQAVVALDDGLSGRGGWGAEQVKILAGSVVAKLDGKPAAYTLDLPARRLRIALPGRSQARSGTLFVDFENVFGQHVVHPRIELNRGGGQNGGAGR